MNPPRSAKMPLIRAIPFIFFSFLLIDTAISYDQTFCKNPNKTYKIIYGEWPRNIELKKECRMDCQNKTDIDQECLKQKKTNISCLQG